jgi:hypothetical protein
MTTTTTASATSPSRAALRPILLVSLAAALIASIATEAYGLVARVAGVPMAAGTPGAHATQPIYVGMFAMGVMICTFWGTVLALLLARFAKQPARTYVRTTVALTILSLADPLAAGGGTAISTRLTLAGGHLVAAAIIIPIVTRRLARR